MTRKTMAATMTLVAGLSASGLAQAAPVSGQGTWETTLKARDANGNPVALLSGTAVNPNAVYLYDTVLNVTWLANAYGTGGTPNWDSALAWADSLSYTVGGTVYHDWRLPTVKPVNGSVFVYADAYNGSTDRGWNISAPGGASGPGNPNGLIPTASELAHMFFNTLGNKAAYDTGGNSQSGSGLTNTGPFSNLQSASYWSGTEYMPSYPNAAWRFKNHTGQQTYNYKTDSAYAWAVHPGDVVVPLPAGLPLLLTALASFGLLGARRRG